MDTHILKTFSNVKTYELHELSVGFHPLRQFYYNHRSLVKYWLLTRDLIAENLLANKDFFEVEEHVNCVKDILQFEKMTPLSKVLFTGELPLPKYTRYMRIGYV